MSKRKNKLIEIALQLLKNATYADGQATVCTLDCEALEREVKKTLRHTYDRKENSNDHSGNAALLARYFGTDAELETAERLLAERNRLGHAPAESGQFQYDMSRKYYKRLCE